MYSGGNINPASQETQIYNRLNQLQNELSCNYTAPEDNYYSAPYRSYSAHSVDSGEVDRLEKMMETMSETVEEDKEVTQLSSMMDKILDIQHPDRVQQRLKEQSAQYHGQVFAFKTAPKSAAIIA